MPEKEMPQVEGAHADRSTWTENDIATLSADERLLAVVAFQVQRYPNNIQYTRELLALWLRRPVEPSDFEGMIFKPSRVNLTYGAFNSAVSEIVERVRDGRMILSADILERHPDVRDYVVKPFGEGAE